MSYLQLSIKGIFYDRKTLIGRQSPTLELRIRSNLNDNLAVVK